MVAKETQLAAPRPSRVPVLGIGIDPVTMPEALALCLQWAQSAKAHLVVTPNAEILYASQKDHELTRVLTEADLVIPDGSGVLLGAKLAGRRLPERVAGVDLASGLMQRLAEQRGTVFVLGGSPESNSACAQRLPQLFPGIRVVGSHHGYFQPDDEEGIVAQINVAEPDLLLAGLGSPKQEKWLYRYLPRLRTRVAIGIGGGIDVWAGRAVRAPRWMQKAGLEWLYRTVKMGRYRRVLPALARFLLAALRDR